MFLLNAFAIFVSLLFFSPACTRVDTTQPDGAAPPAQLYTADALVIPSDEQSDDALTVTRRMDRATRTRDGQLPQLPPSEHLRRASVYQGNRAFEEAREHWRALIARYPEDVNVPTAHFGIGRTLFQERRYEEALPVFQKLGDSFPGTESGRDGFYYVAATLLRMNRPAEAAARYAEYLERYPQGERIENAYLNVIDSLREAGRFDDALPWIEKTRARFNNQPASTSALFARLRLDLARSDWTSALRAGDELSRLSLRGVNATSSEIAFLRAYALERSGQKEAAVRTYQGIPDAVGSYFGGRATARLKGLEGAAKQAASARESRVNAEARRAAANYPASYRDEILRAVQGRSLDPRLILAIMRQESGFNPRAKSQAGARGLLQLVPDTAAKYVQDAGVGRLHEDDLYRPDVNLKVAAAYLADLFRMFPGRTEAVVASYNGGEDNVERWVRRTAHDEPGIFTSEVGFTETKDYVNKVMANYRAYQQLYTEDLRPRR